MSGCSKFQLVLWYSFIDYWDLKEQDTVWRRQQSTGRFPFKLTLIEFEQFDPRVLLLKVLMALFMLSK